MFLDDSLICLIGAIHIERSSRYPGGVGKGSRQIEGSIVCVAKTPVSTSTAVRLEPTGGEGACAPD